jgi:predicted dehydrogenase
VTKTANIGLIGLGNMGRNHLRVLSMLKGVNLSFIYDQDHTAAARLAATHNVPTFDTLAKCLQQPLDGVVICTPTSTHNDMLKAAATSARHVFVEKPMGATLAQAQEMAAFAQSGGIHLQVGYIERFNTAVQQLKQVLETSGGVVSIDFTRTNKLSNRITDVDVITDLMIHDIDLALHLNGPVAKVAAHGVVDGGLVALASALLTHTNGTFSRIQASRMTEKKIRKIEATCKNVFVDCELVRKEVVVHRQSELTQQSSDTYTINAMQQNVHVSPQEGLLLELQAFVGNILGGQTAVPTAADDVAAMTVCDQIQKQIYA